MNAPIITVLTSQPGHSTLRALASVATEKGVAMRCARSVDARSSVVFQWSYARLAALASVRRFCTHHGIEHINAEPLSKWNQLVRLVDADIPVPDSRRAPTLLAAREAAELLGYPVVIKPNWGFKSLGVELIQDAATLERAWTRSHRVVQRYLPEGTRCTRILVIGDRALSAVTRVANDGFHATYDHGRRGTLEPYARLREREALAVAACRAVGVEVGGVDLVDTANGPRILEVNHICVEFGDHQLHGPDAVSSLAAWLVERAHVRAPPAPERRAPRVRIVTKRPGDPGLQPLVRACRMQGFEPVIGSTTDPTAEATWFWGVSATEHRRGVARLHALAMPVLNGHAPNLWRDRARLFRAGIPVPRSRIAARLDAALSIAEEFGYPLRFKTLGARRALQIPDEQTLRAAWPRQCPSRCLLQPASYAAATRLRVWIAGDRALLAERRSRTRWRSLPVRQAPCEVALAACRVLRVDSGYVDLTIVDEQLLVQRVVARSRWIGGLSTSNEGAALRALTTTLSERIQAAARVTPHPSTGPRPMTLLLARDYNGPGSGCRIWNIQALLWELQRRGHRIIGCNGLMDRKLVEQAHFIIQDPLHAFGLRKSGDELDRFLYENAADRCHLLRQRRRGTLDKRAMHSLAVELGVRVPAIHERDTVTAEQLPLVAKPRFGSLGIGVSRVNTLAELRLLPSRGMMLQQLIDAKVSSVVSVRVVTVVDRIVAAALFHNSRGICSNLAQGGHAIPLTGPGCNLHLTRAEHALLERIGLDPRCRAVPAEVAQMAATIGCYHARHGAQMIGQDFVVDEHQRWYFLEINLGFGTAVFNATDGEGYPSSGRGLTHAGRVLADAIEAHFGRGGASNK